MFPSPIPIPVWFVCKLCRAYFEKVEEFIEHKKETHLVEFQNAKCIIFEEFPHDSDQAQSVFDDGLAVNRHVQSGIPSQLILPPGPPTPLIKSEPTEVPEEDAFDYSDPFLNLNENQNQLSQDPAAMVDTLRPKTELVTFFNEDPNSESNKGGVSDSVDKMEIKIKTENYDSISHVERQSQSQIQRTSANSMLSRASNRLQCRNCYRKFNFESQLQIHVAICKKSGPKKQYVTSRRSRTAKVSMDKLNCTSGTVSYKPCICSICGEGFPTLGFLEIHKSIHSDLYAPFKCQRRKCSAAFKTKEGLNEHMRYAHPFSRNFICPHVGCSKLFKFKDQPQIMLHLASHTAASAVAATSENGLNYQN